MPDNIADVYYRNLKGKHGGTNRNIADYLDLEIKAGQRKATDLWTGDYPVNLLTANQASMETDASGWAAGANSPTVGRSTFQFLDGAASLFLTSASAATMNAQNFPSTSVPAAEGRRYTARASFKADATARTCQVNLLYYTDGLGANGFSLGSTITNTTTGWTEAVVTAAAPAGTAYVRVEVQVNSPAASETHFVDRISLAETG